MELNDQSFAPTLAHKLGDVPHVSGLLRRIAQVSGAGERVAEWLFKVAVTRGASHYRRDFDPTLPADLPAISDEEIGVALCLGQNPYNLDALRAAAQLLSSPRTDAARLCRLAEQERCEPVLLHIAGIAQTYAPEQEPWAYLREHLLPRRVLRTEALPHWTRLVVHTGVTPSSPRAGRRPAARREAPGRSTGLGCGGKAAPGGFADAFPKLCGESGGVEFFRRRQIESIAAQSAELQASDGLLPGNIFIRIGVSFNQHEYRWQQLFFESCRISPNCRAAARLSFLSEYRISLLRTHIREK